MNCHYEYFLRLSTFRNIDLPLQGVYFLQFKVHSDSSRTVVVPYSAANGQLQAGDEVPCTLHSLFSPQIALDDSMQSTGFVIQFSDEDILLTDAFRISIKDDMVFGVQAEQLHLESFISTYPLIIEIDLLFSNASDVGGLDSIIESPSSAVFPSEFIVVACQRLILDAPNSVQYFRTPLGLLREYDTEEEERSDREYGEIFPCAFLEGVMISSCIKLELGPEMYSLSFPHLVNNVSDEFNVHPMEVEKCILEALEKTKVFHDLLIADLGFGNRFDGTPGSPIPSKDPNGIGLVGRIDRLSSSLFIVWNGILDQFPRKIRRNIFRTQWKDSLLGKCRRYIRPKSSTRAKESNDILAEEMFTFPLARKCVPFLYSDNLGAAPSCAPGGHGAHLIVLVHGYQGTTNDMRLIRNTIACLCPEALIFSSSANEGQTDGDIETMGARLAMELKDFISLHSSSFSIINRISFIGHSLGGLIVRAAMPLLCDFQEKMYVYISLSTPHLGISNKLIEGGVAFLRLFKKAELLEQLTLKDSIYIRDSFLHHLSTISSFSWFQRIILVGSWQDQYAPISSASISPSLDDSNAALLARNIRQALFKTSVITVDVDFNIPDGSSIDSVIGRAAHIKFLESPVLIQLLILVNADMFDI